MPPTPHPSKAQRLAESGGRRADVLACIRDFIGKNRYPPSVRDIQQALGISSTSVVDYHLERLEETGHIMRTSHKARSIRVTDGEAK